MSDSAATNNNSSNINNNNSSTTTTTTTNKETELACIKGGAAIKKYAVLNDKRHILTRDTDNNVAIYDVLKVVKTKDLGPVDFDTELEKTNQKVYIPNWFTVDLKTGVSYWVHTSFLASINEIEFGFVFE